MNGNGPTAVKRPRMEGRPATPATPSTSGTPQPPSASQTGSAASTPKPYQSTTSNAASSITLPTTTTPPAWATAAQSELAYALVQETTKTPIARTLCRSYHTRSCVSINAVAYCCRVCNYFLYNSSFYALKARAPDHRACRTQPQRFRVSCLSSSTPLVSRLHLQLCLTPLRHLLHHRPHPHLPPHLTQPILSTHLLAL